MATRFYLPASGAAAVSPAFSTSWVQTTGAVRRRCVLAKTNTSVTGLTIGETVAAAEDVLYAQYVSDALPGGKAISGTIQGIIECSQASGAFDFCSQVVAWVVKSDGTSRGELRAPITTALSNEWSTFPARRFFPRAGTQTVNTVNAHAGDRIVLEIGIRPFNALVGAPPRNGTIRFGDENPSTDMPFNEASASTNNAPWIEFSTDIFTPDSPPNPPENLGSVPTSSSLNFTWDAPSAGTVPEGYKVRIDGGTPVDVGLLFEYLFTGLAPLTSYTLEVVAYNYAGESDWATLVTSTIADYPGQVIFPPDDPLCVPVSNLGQGNNVAVVQTRGGGQILGELPSSQLGWGRRLDDLSETNVTIPVSSMSTQCCGLLADTHTWGHEIQVYRDGAESWVGPIVNITENGEGVQIRALDVLGFMVRRATRGRVNGAPVFAVDEAVDDVTEAFTLGGWDGADPNVLAYLEVLGAGTGPLTQRDIPFVSAYYFDTLDQLGDIGVNFTTVGRRIILWPDTLTLGRVPTLLPSQHLSSDVTIVEDGMALSEVAIVTSDNGLWGVSTTPSFPTSDPFYGPVETITNIPGLATTQACEDAANSVRAQNFPAPVRLVIPDGSTLTTDAPYSIGDLVPGVLMPVSHRGRCRSVAGDFILTSLQVTQTPEGETVQISVAPVSSAVES